VSGQRHVFSSGEIPHKWFHRTQDSARNSGRSLYFENDTIYSYGSHFPIARHVEGKKKRQAVLFTTQSHSVTTSGHCSAVRSSIPSNTLIFHVPNVNVSSDWQASVRHQENIADYVKRIESAIVASARGRSSWTKESNQTGAVNLVAECKAYAAFFSLKLPKLPVVPALDSKEMQAIKTREAKNAAQKAEKTRLEKIERAKLEAQQAEQWRNGTYNGYLYNQPVMLRIRTFNADESAQFAVSQVETSRGARIPVSHALRGLRFVRAVVARGEAFQTNGHKFHLGHYSIDRIDVDGTLTAGCHVISYAEIERIAPLLESMLAMESIEATPEASLEA
jgi:hypothetical protein